MPGLRGLHAMHPVQRKGEGMLGVQAQAVVVWNHQVVASMKTEKVKGPTYWQLVVTAVGALIVACFLGYIVELILSRAGH